MSASPETREAGRDREICCASVFTSGVAWGHRCENSAKVQRNGKWYCGVHDPERRRLLDAKWRAKQERESQVRAAAVDVFNAEGAVVAAAMDYDDWGSYHLELNEACHALKQARASLAALQNSDARVPSPEAPSAETTDA